MLHYASPQTKQNKKSFFRHDFCLFLNLRLHGCCCLFLKVQSGRQHRLSFCDALTLDRRRRRRRTIYFVSVRHDDAAAAVKQVCQIHYYLSLIAKIKR
jgi:hypothetical protein